MKEKRLLFVVLIFSFTLRLGYVLFYPQEQVKDDAQQYDTIAYNLSKGYGFSLNPKVPTPIRAPFYPFFLSGIYFLFGQNYTIVRIIQGILSAFLCIIIYYIAKNIFSKKVAMISAGILALYPVLIVYIGLILTETLFTFLFAISILLLIQGVNKINIYYFALSGFFLGIATLTRPVTLLFPLLILLVIVLTKKKLFISWCILIFVFSLTLVPWLIRNYNLFGSFRLCSISTGYGLFTSGNMAKGYTFDESYAKYAELCKQYPEPTIFIPKQSPAIELEKKLQKEGIFLIKENFKNYILVVIKRLPRFWWTSHSSVFGVDRSISEYLQSKNYLHLFIRIGLLGFHGIILVFALVGIILSLSHWRSALILFVILIYFTCHITFDFVPRYHLPAIPYIFIFTSVALENIYKRLRNQKKNDLRTDL